ncbi:DUF397 domain-containing protein [Streptomyces meridianus]|uniref:DUF397 domain-containing protein n=1 Tax=Streptomyces meridianus TaxID=2938945 RepID=A0ABT0X514_9ACTN|nr:DUF397 domain-containing protein [Streptomyces meridianus]MCM2577631.1 DUF397 domain-containing protein [Streptomyces meridianus]
MSTEAAWITSSYSDSGGGNCVEVAVNSGQVLVRDSKDRSGPRLSFEADAWAEFVAFAAGQRLR